MAALILTIAMVQNLLSRWDEGTTNYVKKIYAVDLTITGKGTLKSKDLGVTQQSTADTRLASSLYIKDTTIKVAGERKS